MPSEKLRITPAIVYGVDWRQTMPKNAILTWFPIFQGVPKATLGAAISTNLRELRTRSEIEIMENCKSTRLKVTTTGSQLLRRLICLLLFMGSAV